MGPDPKPKTRLTMNLPNGLTVARIIVTPAIAALPFVDNVQARFWAFLLFLAAAITDWFA